MPLHADDVFHLVALDGLDDAVGRPCRHVEARTGLVYRLMVERIDTKLLAEQVA